jgi:hypothetical protein
VLTKPVEGVNTAHWYMNAIGVAPLSDRNKSILNDAAGYARGRRSYAS